MGYLRRAAWIALKDLRLEWRTGEKLSSMAFFSVLLLVLLHFAFDFSRLTFEQVGVGVLWVCITFAGIVGLGHSFLVEREDDCLLGLLSCPGDRSAIFLGKLVSNGIFVGLVEAIVLPLAAFLFGYDLRPVLGPLVLLMLLYTVGFVSLGTLLAGMAARIRRGQFLLTILLFPFLLPVIMTSVRAAGKLLAGQSLGDIQIFLIFNSCYDVIMLVLSLLFFEYVVEE